MIQKRQQMRNKGFYKLMSVMLYLSMGFMVLGISVVESSSYRIYFTILFIILLWTLIGKTKQEISEKGNKTK